MYEENKDFDNAIDYYSRAVDSGKEGTLTETERKIEYLKYLEDKRAKIKCKNCNTTNPFGNLKCKNCNKWMLLSYFNYIKENIPILSLSIAAVFIFSTLIIGFNLSLYRNIIFYALIFINLNVLDSVLKKRH